jgi:pyridoxine kinase
MRVLSIQSTVAHGHVGNAAARLPLERLGHEVMALDTVRLAHHPAHGAFRGRVTDAQELSALVEGLDAVGALAGTDAVLSGYMGSLANGRATLDAVARVRARNRRAIYALDPVMGERGRGFYVREELATFFRDEALPKADLVLPNLFELDVLSGRTITDIEDMRRAAHALLARGPRIVLVKGIETPATLGVLAVEKGAAWFVETPRLETAAHGAGDAFAAFFLGHYLKRAEPGWALGRAAGAQHALMRWTAKAGGKDLALVAAQDAWTRPRTLFRARRLR